MSKEFIGFNKNDLESLGFKKDRDLPFGDEYHIEYSPKVESKLKELGFEKTWGHEGMSTMYSTFKCDNKEHPDYGKSFISVRENTAAENSLNVSGQGAIIEEYVVKQQKELLIKELQINESNEVVVIHKGDNSVFIEHPYVDSKGEFNNYTVMVKIGDLEKELNRIKYNNNIRKIPKTIKIIETEDYNKLPSKILENALNNKFVTSSINGGDAEIEAAKKLVGSYEKSNPALKQP